ncbi:MAG: threonine--tRNA ligase, partial [Candidatus Diapherotrites archaeon]|nr:threonine--tRNA ligase [Candidatus Diapherotrites archaeon]
MAKVSAEKEFKNLRVVSKIVSDLQKDVPVYSFGKLRQVGLFKDAVLLDSSKIGSLKLLTISGAYFKGDSQQESLTRLQGVAFSSAKELKEFLEQRAEAEKRSHLVLGKDLELFSFHDESPAMPFFLPKGYVVWREIRKFLEDIYFFEDYKVVRTPQVFSKTLWETSGHWSHYRQNMYELEIDGREFALKPMNCPSHCLIFGERMRSYKELPLGIADFGNLHRHELSGVVHGLTRVRKLSQDDSHIFCMHEQIEHEISNLLKFIDKIYSTFGFKNYAIELSTRPDKFLGEIETWNSAESALKNALKKAGKDFRINEGDGAFYGPKIDLHVKDVLNRSWQLATIQLDYQMPQRFNLSFEGQDGKKHFPVMIHRALIGSFERFIGI